MKKKRKNKALNQAADIMTDCTEQEVNDESQKESYENYLQIDDDRADELVEVEQENIVNDEFDDLTDDELEREYEKVLDTADEARTERQEALLSQTKERYLKIKFYREFDEASGWFEQNYPDKSFEKIVVSDKFLDFAAGIKLPVRELVRRFMSMSEVSKEQQHISGPGSAKSTGSTVGKDYFSPAEVERMSEEEVGQNLEIIKKSMRKWK